MNFIDGLRFENGKLTTEYPLTKAPKIFGGQWKVFLLFIATGVFLSCLYVGVYWLVNTFYEFEFISFAIVLAFITIAIISTVQLWTYLKIKEIKSHLNGNHEKLSSLEANHLKSTKALNSLELVIQLGQVLNFHTDDKKSSQGTETQQALVTKIADGRYRIDYLPPNSDIEGETGTQLDISQQLLNAVYDPNDKILEKFQEHGLSVAGFKHLASFNQRLIIVYTYYYQLDDEHIAFLTDKTVDAVRQLRFLALQEMKMYSTVVDET